MSYQDDVAELTDATRHLIDWARAEGRLAKPGWARVATALDRVEAHAGSVTPNQQGGAPVSSAHPDTSRQAAGVAKVGSQQHALLWIIGVDQDGSTSWEAAQHDVMKTVRPNVAPNQVASRMKELHRKHLVRKLVDPSTGEVVKRPTRTSAAEVYVITDTGRTELDRLGHPTASAS